MQRSNPVCEVNRARNDLLCLSNYPFMDDTYVDPIKRRNELLCEVFREYQQQIMQINALRKRVKKQDKKPTQKIEDLGRYIHLVSSVRRTRRTLQYTSGTKQRRVHRRKVNLPLPPKFRGLMEEDSQDNLCQAVQRMQLNLETSIRKSERKLSSGNFLAKLESPCEIAEDLAKLCMKD